MCSKGGIGHLWWHMVVASEHGTCVMKAGDVSGAQVQVSSRNFH